MSSAAVEAATGKGWTEWFRILDAAGAKKMPHKEIAAHLHETLGVRAWWCQMVTVGYEQARGLREKHQTAKGYQVSGSRVVGVPVARLFAAWQNAATRRTWLPDPDFIIRRSTPAKSMRITWIDGQTHVEANFYAKGPDRSQVAVQHNKLADPAAAARMKAYWAKALDELRSALE